LPEKVISDSIVSTADTLAMDLVRESTANNNARYLNKERFPDGGSLLFLQASEKNGLLFCLKPALPENFHHDFLSSCH
jgi:hypothetical protein